MVLLLDGFTATCLNKPCGGGWTPLMFAVKSNALEIARYLLDQGADVNAKVSRARTCMKNICLTPTTDVIFF